jgi:hypothetical protein
MKKILFLIILIISITCLHAQDLEFRIYCCETTSLVTLKNGRLRFINTLLENIKYDSEISKDDLIVLNNEIKDINTKKGNEVWLNHCIDDGTNLKFKIIDHDIIVKKVFVGNYMDRRLNKIILIINKYLEKINTNSFIAVLGYGSNNENYIKNEIADQESCPMTASEKYKNAMLNSWCEF